jgi:hypothetical protein
MDENTPKADSRSKPGPPLHCKSADGLVRADRGTDAVGASLTWSVVEQILTAAADRGPTHQPARLDAMKERASAPVLRRGVASALGKRQDRGPVMVDVGVDLHRKRSHVVALDPAGEVMLSRRIGNAPPVLRIFGELEPGPVEVAFEATYGWSWLRLDDEEGKRRRRLRLPVQVDDESGAGLTVHPSQLGAPRMAG